MNTKGSKGIIGITLAIIMIASIFAAIAPSTTAGVDAQGIITAGKTGPSEVPPTVGYPVSFTLTIGNPDANLTWNGSLYDVPPNGSWQLVQSGITLAPGITNNWPYTYYVTQDDINNGSILNTMWAIGHHGFGTAGQVQSNGTSQHPVYFEENPPELNVSVEAVGCLEVDVTGWASDNASILNFTWDFGPGEDPRYVINTTGPLPNTTRHTFETCGEKTIYFTACNADDCITVPYTFDVACGPTADMTYSPMCFEANGTLITFDGTESSGESDLNYSWEFTGGFTGDNDNEAITNVTVNATVTATLTVTDALGCEANISKTVGPCSGCSLRIYGTFGQGPGDFTVTDPELPGAIYPENKPYTDPMGPFYPQHPQAPRKDFITFNPAIMPHNSLTGAEGIEYEDLYFVSCPFGSSEVQRPNEKVFKRMWYEKEWFKDEDKDGVWDVVTTKGSSMTIDDWFASPACDREPIREWNNDPALGDLYAPAINQEFTYMFLDDNKQPTMIQTGSYVLIPMASRQSRNGIDSFDALLNDGRDIDYVRVESEDTLGFDIDGDNVMELLSNDTIELNGTETVVLVLDEKTLYKGGEELQFFDHKVRVKNVAGPNPAAILVVSDNEGGGSVRETTVTVPEGSTAFFYRGKLKGINTPELGATFFVRVVSVNWLQDGTGFAVVEVGRMFGQTYANIGTNPYWNQKAFMVDGVFYNVVAIKAQDNCIKYITFRQKLPKREIKLYGKHLEVWLPTSLGGGKLPEMPPFNGDHVMVEDVLETWTHNKIGAFVERPALDIDYIEESVEVRYRGELKEIYNESYDDNPGHSELWLLEWFWTLPEQYTEFRLPGGDRGDKYLVTLSWIAPESETTIWDGQGETDPIAINKPDRFKFWYQDCTGPLYINESASSIRLYGTFGEGPGDQSAIDPESSLSPENKPYFDPTGPFDPLSGEVPAKDFMTLDPAIMDHNQGYPELLFYPCSYGPEVQTPKEKVFKRMWYQKEWFKDDGLNTPGEWDVVTDAGVVMTLDEWKAMPAWERPAIREWNCDGYDGVPGYPDYEEDADTYGPAIEQEFTYMFLDENTMPMMVRSGSRVLIPMAWRENPGYGIDSFDALLGDGVSRDYVSVESEATLGFDIDGDTVRESMDMDDVELNGNESVVLVLPEKTLYTGGNAIQFFGHEVRAVQTYPGSGVSGPKMKFEVRVNEGCDGPSSWLPKTVEEGDIAFYHRNVFKGFNTPSAPAEFYIRVIAVNAFDDGTGYAEVEVGRMFGQTYANIGPNGNMYWGQKAFMVDGVFYNVVAIKAQDNCIKYITIRQKLPKMGIKLYGEHLCDWGPDVILPELPPFNEDHEICWDVQKTWTTPSTQQDKIGEKKQRGPLEITYVEEDVEERFKGELKEIYNETFIGGIEDEFWMVEWFYTQPWQYTAFVMPDDQIYLVTLAWRAPQAEGVIWDGMDSSIGYQKPPYTNLDDMPRVKFWYAPYSEDRTTYKDLYVNKVGAESAPLTLLNYYDNPLNEGDGEGDIDIEELVNAILDFLNGRYPFSAGGPFDRADLITYIEDFIAQP